MATCPAYSAAKAAVQARFLLPAWGKLKVRNSRRSDITDVLDKILEKDQFVQANRVRALISKMLNFAIEEEMIEEGFANPAAHLPRRPAETPRDRYLTGDEIRRLWELLPQSPMGAIYRMILLTGQRPGEVKSMRYAHFAQNHATRSVLQAMQAEAEEAERGENSQEKSRRQAF